MKNLLLVAIVLFITSCGDFSAPSNDQTTKKAQSALSTESELGDNTVKSFMQVDRNSYGREQLVTEASQSNFNKVQPPLMLDWSLERDNLNERNQRWNDKNKVSYIYLVSDMGTIMAYFTIKGKVSSVNSKLTTNQQMIKRWTSSSISGVVESPSMDGSYGSNGDAVFFYLTDGTYMEWAGNYLLCDNYVKMSQKPIMTYDATEELQ